MLNEERNTTKTLSLRRDVKLAGRPIKEKSMHGKSEKILSSAKLISKKKTKTKTPKGQFKVNISNEDSSKFEGPKLNPILSSVIRSKKNQIGDSSELSFKVYGYHSGSNSPRINFSDVINLQTKVNRTSRNKVLDQQTGKEKIAKQLNLKTFNSFAGNNSNTNISDYKIVDSEIHSNSKKNSSMKKIPKSKKSILVGKKQLLNKIKNKLSSKANASLSMKLLVNKEKATMSIKNQKLDIKAKLFDLHNRIKNVKNLTYANCQNSIEEIEKAATKIQANFKGYLVRKTFSKYFPQKNSRTSGSNIFPDEKKRRSLIQAINKSMEEPMEMKDIIDIELTINLNSLNELEILKEKDINKVKRLAGVYGYNAMVLQKLEEMVRRRYAILSKTILKEINISNAEDYLENNEDNYEKNLGLEGPNDHRMLKGKKIYMDSIDEKKDSQEKSKYDRRCHFTAENQISQEPHSSK